jgi:hypothetical protein
MAKVVPNFGFKEDKSKCRQGIRQAKAAKFVRMSLV